MDNSTMDNKKNQKRYIALRYRGRKARPNPKANCVKCGNLTRLRAKDLQIWNKPIVALCETCYKTNEEQKTKDKLKASIDAINLRAGHGAHPDEKFNSRTSYLEWFLMEYYNILNDIEFTIIKDSPEETVYKIESHKMVVAVLEDEAIAEGEDEAIAEGETYKVYNASEETHIYCPNWVK